MIEAQRRVSEIKDTYACLDILTGTQCLSKGRDDGALRSSSWLAMAKVSGVSHHDLSACCDVGHKWSEAVPCPDLDMRVP